jgi:hypothetical protein
MARGNRSQACVVHRYSNMQLISLRSLIALTAFAAISILSSHAPAGDEGARFDPAASASDVQSNLPGFERLADSGNHNSQIVDIVLGGHRFCVNQDFLPTGRISHETSFRLRAQLPALGPVAADERGGPPDFNRFLDVLLQDNGQPAAPPKVFLDRELAGRDDSFPVEYILCQPMNEYCLSHVRLRGPGFPNLYYASQRYRHFSFVCNDRTMIIVNPACYAVFGVTGNVAAYYFIGKEYVPSLVDIQERLLRLVSSFLSCGGNETQTPQ